MLRFRNKRACSPYSPHATNRKRQNTKAYPHPLDTVLELLLQLSRAFVEPRDADAEARLICGETFLSNVASYIAINRHASKFLKLLSRRGRQPASRVCQATDEFIATSSTWVRHNLEWSLLSHSDVFILLYTIGAPLSISSLTQSAASVSGPNSCLPCR
mgnify:CR=1 FL=1